MSGQGLMINRQAATVAAPVLFEAVVASCAQTTRRSPWGASVGWGGVCGRALPKSLILAVTGARRTRLGTNTTLPHTADRLAWSAAQSRPEQSSAGKHQVVPKASLPLWFIRI